MSDESNVRKLHPRLRVVRNGDAVVNAVRSDATTTVACIASTDRQTGISPAPIYEKLTPEATRSALVAGAVQGITAAAPAPVQPPPEHPPADNAFVNVFIELFPERAQGRPGKGRQALPELVERITTRLGEATLDRSPISAAVLPRRNFISATVPVTMLAELEQHPAVAFIHPADPLKLDLPVATAASQPTPRAIGTLETHGTGEGVIIGIIDVGGFDFTHPDFLDENGGTRFVAIWDQGGDFRRAPRKFRYGSEFLQEHLNAAIRAAATPGTPPATWLEPQSQREESSHATHVASIAAGKSGVCPKALIAGVLIDVPSPEDPAERRRFTFSDTSRITHAIEYLLDLGARLGLPISINISLGTNGGAHDGSSGVSRWLDAYLSTPGRAICIAAGNAGQETAQTEGDLGWIMGRIHTSGRIPARGLEIELEWTVVGNGIVDVSENELEIWYGAQDRFTVAVLPPDGGEWIEVESGEYVENRQLSNGTRLSLYNELYHPTNGHNYIALYLSPNLDPEPDRFRGIQAGTWRVRLRGEDIRDGEFHAWIERDDPIEVGRGPGGRLFRFPSFFSMKSNIDSHSISSLACGHRVITVANLDHVRQRIHATSSQGPTRDGRFKPEIAAPGSDIVAANGFGARDEPWVAMTGTSMAAPYVTGVVGLMLAANRELTAAQCGGILQRTARPLPGFSYQWGNDVGYGRIHPEAAVEEARTINRRVERRRGGDE